MNYIFKKRDSETEHGPYTFRQLVLMVTDGKISPDDKVSIEGETKQEYAADVPGLFHMAGRMDVVDEWYAELQASRVAYDDDEAEDDGFDLDELDSLLETQQVTEDDQTEPAWRARLRHVEQQKAAEAELAAGSKIGSIADDVLAEMDEEAEKRKRVNRFGDAIRTLVSSGSQRIFLRLALSFVAANLTAYWILNWSETEAQRAPDRQELASGIRAFPVYGKCSSGEFMFLTVDAMLLAAVVGFFGANALEAIADD